MRCFRNNIFILPILFFLLSCQDTYEFKYYYSPDMQNAVTRVEHDAGMDGYYTYFVEGYYSKDTIPYCCLHRKNRANHQWHAMLTWEDNKPVLLQPYSYFDNQYNCGDKLILRTMDVSEFGRLFEDNSNTVHIKMEERDKMEVLH